MQHVNSLEHLSIQNTWLTVGSFDGVHRGHQEIIRKLAVGAHTNNALAVVLTFDPHPVAILRPDKAPSHLTNISERAKLFSELGVDILVTHPFNTQVASLTAKEFLTNLKAHLGFTQFWVGYDFAMGHNREGNIPTLHLLGNELDYSLHIIEPVTIDGKTISSSQIRKLIADGDVEEAAIMLGRPYQISGTVIEGAKRGRTIGIPTANLNVEENRATPARGVYACRVRVDNAWVNAVTNIGVRPTFENGTPQTSIEAHLLDFSGNLYGQNIKVEFIARLRDEQKFSGIEALVQQINKDISIASKILSTYQHPQMIS